MGAGIILKDKSESIIKKGSSRPIYSRKQSLQEYYSNKEKAGPMGFSMEDLAKVATSNTNRTSESKLIRVEDASTASNYIQLKPDSAMQLADGAYISGDDNIVDKLNVQLYDSKSILKKEGSSHISFAVPENKFIPQLNTFTRTRRHKSILPTIKGANERSLNMLIDDPKIFADAQRSAKFRG